MQRVVGGSLSLAVDNAIENGKRKLQQIRFISPVGSVGGGISITALHEALAQEPHFIACDAGAPPMRVRFR